MATWQCRDCGKIFDRWETHFCGELPDYLKQIAETPLGEKIISERMIEHPADARDIKQEQHFKVDFEARAYREDIRNQQKVIENLRAKAEALAEAVSSAIQKGEVEYRKVNTTSDFEVGFGNGIDFMLELIRPGIAAYHGKEAKDARSR